jgi:hypothetical protein
MKIHGTCPCGVNVSCLDLYHTTHMHTGGDCPFCRIGCDNAGTYFLERVCTRRAYTPDDALTLRAHFTALARSHGQTGENPPGFGQLEALYCLDPNLVDWVSVSVAYPNRIEPQAAHLESPRSYGALLPHFVTTLDEVLARPINPDASSKNPGCRCNNCG